MIGSLYAVFMGPTTLEVPKPAMNFKPLASYSLLLVELLLLGLEKSKDFLEKKAK